MRWIYGRQDFQSAERSEESCYLMTNGLGGFSSLTAAGAAARNDHAFLMACVKAPNSRYNLIHRIREEVDDVLLSTQEMGDGTAEKGYRHLVSFTYEDTPVWRFLADGVEIRKEAAMVQGENTIALRYEIRNRRRSGCAFRVTPFYQFAPKGEDMEEGAEPALRGDRISGRAGDLLYFPGHVAMYLGGGEYIHSTGRAGDNGVTINSLYPEAANYRADLPGQITAVGSYF